MSQNRIPALGDVIVRKYGGSSLATVDRIAAVARDIRAATERGRRVVVVVSAMGKTTDELADLALQANPDAPRRELDMLLSVGERITMSLLSMALAAEGCRAISFTGSQCGIITDTSHTDARIIEVRGDRVREALAAGFIVVVAGFQGVSLEREITTLGRGGSDTTAVALAAALGAERCEILKDVDGVMTADPHLVSEATSYDTLSWEQLRRIAASGCGVVHLRAVEYAAEHGVRLCIRSSFHDRPGTEVGPAAGPLPRTNGAAAPSCPVSDRENRFRPLAMTVAEQTSRLRLATDDDQLARRWQAEVLTRLDSARTVAEWLDRGRGFRWEVIAPQEHLEPLVTRLVGLAGGCGQVDHETPLACISLAGGRPDSWLEVQRHVGGILERLRVRSWRLRADGSALRILIPQTDLADLPRQLHRELLGP